MPRNLSRHLLSKKIRFLRIRLRNTLMSDSTDFKIGDLDTDQKASVSIIRFQEASTPIKLESRNIQCSLLFLTFYL
jgi:hypothetical protein